MLFDPEKQRPKNPDGTPYTILEDDPLNVNKDLQKQELKYDYMKHAGLLGRAFVSIFGFDTEEIGFSGEIGQSQTKYSKR